MFSKSCEYAIRATIIICQKTAGGQKTNLTEISRLAEVPMNYMAKVLQILTRKKIILSIKGPGGGFFIDEAKKYIKLIEIVRAIDGESIFTGCGLGLKECSEKTPCPLHNSFKKIRNDLHKMLQDTSISELTSNLKSRNFTNLKSK